MLVSMAPISAEACCLPGSAVPHLGTASIEVNRPDFHLTNPDFHLTNLFLISKISFFPANLSLVPAISLRTFRKRSPGVVSTNWNAVSAFAQAILGVQAVDNHPGST